MRANAAKRLRSIGDKWKNKDEREGNLPIPLGGVVTVGVDKVCTILSSCALYFLCNTILSAYVLYFLFITNPSAYSLHILIRLIEVIMMASVYQELLLK